jgi:2-polyprenyl-3-methyl-5-hydroxy-6-metoxy-1,4-benzoquinol methylase
MPSSFKSSQVDGDRDVAERGFTSVGETSVGRGWKRWRRHLKCTIAAYLPGLIVQRVRYEPQQTIRSNWDAEFAGGHWDYLRGSSEIARYGVIASFCHCYSAGGALLDHGCGEGILRRHINLDHFEQYAGVDLSLDAINKAGHHHGGPRTRFMVGDVEDFEPDRRYDVIVFNEMLYYLEDPAAVVLRYRRFLTPAGVFVISMFDMLKSRKIWQMLDAGHRLLESSRAVNQAGHSWTIRVYRPGN